MKNRRGRAALCLGSLLLAAALALTGYNLLSERRADRFAARTAAALETVIPARTAVTTAAAAPATPATTVQTVSVGDGTYIGLLTVPALDLSLPVRSACSAALLRLAPCCWEGSALTGDLIVAGHNYRRQFGGLKLLHVGDEVRFTDADGYVYRYAVSGIETLDDGDTAGMAAGAWDLTLFTCTYDGGRRIAVRCSLAAQ